MSRNSSLESQAFVMRASTGNRLLFTWLNIFSRPFSLLEYVVIFSTKPTGLFDVRAHIEYEVNDLVLCRISTTLAPWPTEILTVYTIMLT